MNSTILLTIAIFYQFTAPKMVFVCVSPGAKRYHLNDKCRGLSNCTYRIVKVKEETAKADGKTLCHWEK
ncbi:hypothetical protein INP83_10825 [Mucilaginibacter sp. 21P]|nr:hypothetical protein INP83_10825 [Mucilaginibacter sp. 21P]